MAKLNWDVNEFPICYSDNDNVVNIEGHKAVVKEDGKVLGVVGKGFNTFYNHQFNDLCEKLELAGAKFENSQELNNGRIVTAQYSHELMPYSYIGFDGEGEGDDSVKSLFTVANGHAGALMLTFFSTTIRIWCMNTFICAMREANKGDSVYFRKRHTAHLKSSVWEFEDNIQQVAEATNEVLHQFNVMKHTPVKRNEPHKMFRNILKTPEFKMEYEMNTNKDGEEYKQNNFLGLSTRLTNKYNTVLDIYNNDYLAKGSRWGIFNAVTGYVEHHVKNEHSKSFGYGQSLKKRAYNLLTA